MKTSKIFMLSLLAAISFAACTDEMLLVDNTSKWKATEGEEVLFNVQSDGFEKDANVAATRTNYGNKYTDANNTYVPIYWGSYDNSDKKWEPDTIYIRSTGCMAGHRWGEYLISSYTNNQLDTASHDATVSKIPDGIGVGGLRWDDTSKEHKFLAIYPASKITDKKYFNDAVASDTNLIELTLPTVQRANGFYTGGNTTYVRPDMKNAIMYGVGTYTPNAGTDTTVTLNFTPLSACLEVTIRGAETENTYKNGLPVSAVILRSSSKNIVGPMTVNMEKGEIQNVHQDYDYKYATISCIQEDGSSTKIATGKNLNVKFFLALGGTDSLSVDDLSIDILLQNNKIYNANLGKVIALYGGTTTHIKHGKYYTVILPTLKLKDSDAGDWQKDIDDDVLFTQLSLVGSAQSFTYLDYLETANFESSTLNTTVSTAYQTLTFSDQVKTGARIFSQKISCGNTTATDEPCAYSGDDTRLTSATLSAMLDTITTTDFLPPTEGAVLMLDYVTYGGGDSEGSAWIDAIIGKLEAKSSNLQLLTDTTTMGGMRNKIAVIIRDVPTSAFTYWTNNGTKKASDVAKKLLFANSTNANGQQSTSLFDYSFQTVSGVTGTPLSGATVQGLKQLNNDKIKQSTLQHDMKGKKKGEVGECPGYDGITEGQGSNANPGAFDGKFSFYDRTAGYIDDTYGLQPFYNTVNLAKQQNGNTANLIQKKKDLCKELLGKLKSDNGKMLYFNDLSGFCVSDNEASLGYWKIRMQYAIGIRGTNGWYWETPWDSYLSQNYNNYSLSGTATAVGGHAYYGDMQLDPIGCNIDDGYYAVTKLMHYPVENVDYWINHKKDSVNEARLTWNMYEDGQICKDTSIGRGTQHKFYCDALGNTYVSRKLDILFDQALINMWYYNTDGYCGNYTPEDLTFGNSRVFYFGTWDKGNRSGKKEDISVKDAYDNGKFTGYNDVYSDRSDLGQGGNTAYQGEEMNYFMQEYLLNMQRNNTIADIPLGWTLMNWLGEQDLVQFCSNGYSGYGLTLPNLIVFHNFQYPLKKKQ